MKYYVIAGNKFEADSFAKKKTLEMWNNGKTSISLSDFVYVSSVDTLRGLSEIQGFYVGTWKNRKDIEEIQLQVKIIKQKMDDIKNAKKVFINLGTDIGFTAQEISSVVPNNESLTQSVFTINKNGIAPAVTNPSVSWQQPAVTENDVRRIVTEILDMRDNLARAIKDLKEANIYEPPPKN